MCTMPSSNTSTSSMSPPSACTAGRIRLITSCTFSRSVVVSVACGIDRIIDRKARRHNKKASFALQGAADKMQFPIAAAVVQTAVNRLPFDNPVGISKARVREKLQDSTLNIVDQQAAKPHLPPKPHRRYRAVENSGRTGNRLSRLIEQDDELIGYKCITDL